MKQGFQGMDSLVVQLLDRVQEMAEISRQLKGLARELHVPFVALS